MGDDIIIGGCATVDGSASATTTAGGTGSGGDIVTIAAEGLRIDVSRPINVRKLRLMEGADFVGGITVVAFVVVKRGFLLVAVVVTTTGVDNR